MLINIQMEWFGGPIEVIVEYTWHVGDPGKLDGPYDQAVEPEPDRIEIHSVQYHDHDVSDLLLMPRVDEQLQYAIEHYKGIV